MTHRVSSIFSVSRWHLRLRSAAASPVVGVLLACLVPWLLASCVTEEEFDDTPSGNFEALWRIMDEHYCFFTEKGVDWDSVHAVYAPQVNDAMSDEQLFEVLGNMLGTLRDGHVNLYSSFDTDRYWSFHENYPSNYSDTLITRYLGTDYKMTNGLKYRILDDNIGYLRCSTFSNSFGSGNLSDILAYFAACRGLIIDLRDNSGGLISAAQQLAARFTNEEKVVGYMCHKTGKGHDDFSSLEPQKVKPSSGVRWQKPVAVLTNRQVYSAANEFVKYMKCFPDVIVVGDQTGGGAGMPFSSELPNGWAVRFSACPMFDANKQSTEDGIAPDYNVSLSDIDFYRGVDTIIEAARRLLVK